MSIAVVEVNRKSILANIEFFREKSPDVTLMAVVKANAYGHGMEGVAQLLDDKVDYFGVARYIASSWYSQSNRSFGRLFSS